MKKIIALILSLFFFFILIYKISPPSTMASNEKIENTVEFVSDLNKQIKDLQTEIDNLQKTNSTLQSNISNLQETNSSLQSDISNLQETNSSLQLDISNLQETNSSLQSDISNLQETNSTLQSDISNLQETNSSLQSDISNLQESNNKGIITNLSELPIATADSPDFVNVDQLNGTSKLYRKMSFTNTFDGKDLTDTIWKFKRDINTNPSQTFNINFISNNVEFYKLYRHYTRWNDYRMDYYPVTGGYWGVYQYHYESGGYTTWSYGYEYQTIKITGGSDVTNPDLIAFLQNNATIQTEELQYKYVEVIDKVNINEVNTEDLVFNLNHHLDETPEINSIITINDLSNDLVDSHFNKTPNVGDYVSRIFGFTESDEVTETYLITGIIQSIGETTDLAPSGTRTPYEILITSVQKIAYYPTYTSADAS